jgi:kynurenine formamidase
MPGRTLILLALMPLAGCSHEPTRPAGAAPWTHVIDLGHPLASTDPSWDGTTAFSRDVVATIERDGYQAGKFATEEHFGTHVDAPSHFVAGRWTVDEIPPDRLIRPGVCVNISQQVRGDPNYRLTVDDLTSFERAHGPIAEGATVLVATGWDDRWSLGHGEYLNMQAGVRHFPGISVEAAAFLANDRRVAAVGIDTPSIDYGMSEHFEAHRVTLATNIYHIENATGLTRLPAAGFLVVVAPIKIKGGTGGPARVLALVQ